MANATMGVDSGSTSSQRIPLLEKVGYSFGDAAANFVFQALIAFQTIFYTDTFGLAAGEAALLLLVARCADAFFDPLFGVLADRTNTRFGRFRPWILVTAIPYGVMAVLAFTTPNFGHTGKLIYAYATYLGLMFIYSANNLPYSALSGVMTGDIAERSSLSSYRFVFAMSAAFVVQAIAPKMLEYFSHGNSQHYDPRAFQIVMTIFGVLSVIFFVITFATTRERIHSPAGQDGSIKKDFADLLKNGPWISLFFVTLLVFITLAMRGGMIFYYFQYYVGKKSLVSSFNAFGLGATLVGIGFSKPLAMRYGKRNVFAVGLFLTAILTSAFMFFPPGAIVLMFACESVRSLIYGTTIPLLWAMMADVADYGEWRTHRRATGIVFSAVVFGLKAGLGFGGAIGAELIGLYGYRSPVNQVDFPQPASALDGIRLTSSIYAAIPFFLAAICLFFYRIDKRLNIEIATELANRRSGAGGVMAAVAEQNLELPVAP
jgi:GPH family glycoside/pentoside/hexuronide:cation symporter